MKTINFTRQKVAEDISHICYSIDNGFPLLKDYKPQISGVVVPFSLLDHQPNADGLLSCLNEFMQVSKDNKLSPDKAINYGLLYLNDFYKNQLNPYELITKAKEIRDGATKGKHNGEKLIGFWSTWSEEPADALALLNVKFALRNSVSVKDIIVKAHDFYKSLKKIKWDGATGGIFAAKYLDEIMEGRFDRDELIETAHEIRETAKKYHKSKWDSDEAEKLVICYSGDVMKRSFSIDKLVETATDLYLQAKKKDKTIDKDRWSDDYAREIAVNHTGRVIEKGLKIEELIKELNDSYKFFENTLPKTGWVFKSNEELSKSATLMYTVVNHLGLEGEDLENEIVANTVRQIIEDEITNSIILMNTVLITTIIASSVATSTAVSS